MVWIAREGQGAHAVALKAGVWHGVAVHVDAPRARREEAAAALVAIEAAVTVRSGHRGQVELGTMPCDAQCCRDDAHCVRGSVARMVAAQEVWGPVPAVAAG